MLGLETRNLGGTGNLTNDGKAFHSVGGVTRFKRRRIVGSKPRCADGSWLFAGHDVDGEVPGKAWTKATSFRCRNDDHYDVDDFQHCQATFTNGGDYYEPNGKYNLYFNIIDGYNELRFWYQNLYFNGDTIKEDKEVGVDLTMPDSLASAR
ncbi:uncharacterized protein DFL_007080 [Arthrobotrys flagrans]|uniref:Uncharacterized protein n=1 Tax=Arthrobotrys flagrans TaxID=97331 RepID=A0A436ZV06_ARTFL|nr:hypothetical protein DFL_007080 [Arthrobotrys flagrans]